jgi:hypothetical protein
MQARMYRSDVNFRKTLGPVLLRIRGPAFLNLWCVLAERFVLKYMHRLSIQSLRCTSIQGRYLVIFGQLASGR